MYLTVEQITVIASANTDVRIETTSTDAVCLILEDTGSHHLHARYDRYIDTDGNITRYDVDTGEDLPATLEPIRFYLNGEKPRWCAY